MGFVEIAPVLCAGVTVYKGLKVTDTKPGDWVVISGIGGLGHMAVQYAKAMGLNVAAVDVDDAKLWLAERLGATVTVNAATDTDPAAFMKKDRSAAPRALVTAVSPQGLRAGHRHGARGGTVSLNGLPPGDFPLDIFGMVLNGITVRGSIVGTRLDLQESLAFRRSGQGCRHRHQRSAGQHQRHLRAHARRARSKGRIVLDMMPGNATCCTPTSVASAGTGTANLQAPNWCR
jgi:propanol-preferring alcohol dehydrogenase